jgi:micrococcal nuclease
MQRFPIHWLALASLLTGCGQGRYDLNRHDVDQPIVVTEVIDGDTIEIIIGSSRERVRLLGIDAPESVHPTVPEQCFGAEASAAMASLLSPGAEVHVERDQQARDHFGRLLLYVIRSADGLNINLWMVEQGLVDTAFYEPNVHYRSDLTAAKRRARRHNRGLWAACDGPDQPLQ